MELLNSLIETAIANRKRVVRADGTDGGLSYASGAVLNHAIGRIVCHVDFTHRNANSRNKHVHCRFDLNGKRIARAALEAKLSAQ